MRGVNVDGDGQADLRVHGGRDKAVYSYAVEDYAWWSEQLGRELGPGRSARTSRPKGSTSPPPRSGVAGAWAPRVLEVSAAAVPVLQARDPDGRRRVREGVRARRRASARTSASSRRATSARATTFVVEPVGEPGAPTIRDVGLAGLRQAG